MRQQLLYGYMIHQRKYRERSHIVHVFSREFGRIDGVLRQSPPPQYQPMCLQASGKTALKSFAKLELIAQPLFLSGDAFFAGFYLNELLLRLCPLEVAMPRTFVQYSATLLQLQHLAEQADQISFLKQILRQFERVLLQELGYALDFQFDASQQAIVADAYYQFDLHDGFRLAQHTHGALLGADLLSMKPLNEQAEFSASQLTLLSQLYRQMITALLGDRPLKSRQLWISHRSSSS